MGENNHFKMVNFTKYQLVNLTINIGFCKQYLIPYSFLFKFLHILAYIDHQAMWYLTTSIELRFLMFLFPIRVPTQSRLLFSFCGHIVVFCFLSLVLELCVLEIIVCLNLRLFGFLEVDELVLKNTP